MRAPIAFLSRLFLRGSSRLRSPGAAPALTLTLTLAGCGDAFVASSSDGSGGSGSGGAGAQGGGGSGSGTSAPGSSTSEGGGSTCSGPDGGDPCRQCLFDQCNGAFCACAAEPDCGGIPTCLGQGFPIDFCWQDNPDGISLRGTLEACGAQKCAECGYEPVEECIACQYEKCSGELNACFSDGECLGFLMCVATCKEAGGTEVTCAPQCNDEHMTGVPLAADLEECTNNLCSAACP
jgi:hypothetical protein